MDNHERDKFYAAAQSAADDDEYELDAPDPAIQERRRQDALQVGGNRIDIDEIYRDAERNRGGEILEDWIRNFRFQFRVKHLLIATAVLAIGLTLVKLKLFWTAAIVLFMLSVAGLYFYLQWEERKQQAEADRRREALYAKRRAQFASRAPGAAADEPLQTEPELPDVPQPPSKVDSMWQEAAAKEPFRFQFSLREMIVTITIAAVVLGAMRLLGGPAATATVLGLVALFGLFVFALGYEPPQIVVLGWWLTLVLYVGVSIFAAVWGGFA